MTAKTNYFSVTNEGELKKIIGLCKGGSEVVLKQHDTDKTKYIFNCEDDLIGYVSIFYS